MLVVISVLDRTMKIKKIETKIMRIGQEITILWGFVYSRGRPSRSQAFYYRLNRENLKNGNKKVKS